MAKILLRFKLNNVIWVHVFSFFYKSRPNELLFLLVDLISIRPQRVLFDTHDSTHVVKTLTHVHQDEIQDLLVRQLLGSLVDSSGHVGVDGAIVGDDGIQLLCGPVSDRHVVLQVGHAWVVDGYIDEVRSNKQSYYLHCNWGHDGVSNGYFLSNVLDTNQRVYNDNAQTRANYQYCLETATFTK